MEFSLPVKLLLADDNPGVSIYLKDLCKREGIVFFAAEDGLSALETFKKEKPQISLINLEQYRSEINGLEVLRRIKQIDLDAYCFIFAHADQKKEMEEAKALGAIMCFIQPIMQEPVGDYIKMIKDAFIANYTEERKCQKANN